MFNLRIRSTLMVLAGVVCVSFAGSVAVQQYASSQMAINSEHYGQIIRAKDLVADVLPPPAYLIESYLEARLLVDEPERLAQHVTRLAELKKQYLDRHTFWADKSGWHSEHGFNEELFNLISRDSHEPAMKFWDTVETRLIPAAKAGDMIAAKTALTEATQFYAAHRQEVDNIVVGATAEQVELEQAARDEALEFSLLELAIVGLALAVTIAGFVLLFRRVIRPVGEGRSQRDGCRRGPQGRDRRHGARARSLPRQPA